ncbi:unnamed protein product [Brassica oleracea]|uniref:GH3 C-terminal domain-containing protein n=1 Tax=Brassica oleracea TaxID=3712 RepID=A0A3P6GX93_BRAOL|nr:unnamed protein product [Brassica oleracea]
MAQYVPILEFYSDKLPLVSKVYGSSESIFGMNVDPLCKPQDVSYIFVSNISYFEFLPKENGYKDEENVFGLLELSLLRRRRAPFPLFLFSAPPLSPLVSLGLAIGPGLDWGLGLSRYRSGGEGSVVGQRRLFLSLASISGGGFSFSGSRVCAFWVWRSSLGSLVVWWCGGPRRLCLSEILLLVLSACVELLSTWLVGLRLSCSLGGVSPKVVFSNQSSGSSRVPGWLVGGRNLQLSFPNDGIAGLGPSSCCRGDTSWVWVAFLSGSSRQPVPAPFTPVPLSSNSMLVDFTCSADISTFPSHYVFYLELKAKDINDVLELDENVKVLVECCSVIEESFGALYRGMRRSGSIGPLEIRVVQQGTFDALMDYFISRGGSMAQYKTPICIKFSEVLVVLENNVLVRF